MEKANKPENHGKHRSVASYNRLRRLLELGVSPRRAAEQLKRTESAVGNMMYLLSLVDMLKEGNPEENIISWHKTKKNEEKDNGQV